MSENKNKWFEVTTTKLVAAPTKAQARRLAVRARVGTTLSTEVTQVPAAAARRALQNVNV